MKSKRSSQRAFYRKILSVVTSASLILTLVPAGPAYAAENERWSDTIDAMLASGECAEGEAIVALLGDEDDALIAQASLLVDEIEPLMEVSTEAIGVAAEEGLAAQSEQGATLALVRSDTLSTEEILRSLADDPRVAFAEPNYYAELADEDETEAVVTATAVLVNPGEEAVAEEGEAVTPDGEALATDEDAASDEAPATAAEEVVAMDDSPSMSESTTTAGIAPQATGSICDLRSIQWGNWDTTGAGMRSPSTLGNYSINVPDFDNPDVGANMPEEVVVAVLDGAVDFTNPDLVDRAYTFSDDLQAQLGCSTHGFNASAESTDGMIINDPNSASDAHGTHCAGIIGASWDGRGTSGVASNVKIVSIQMMGIRDGEDNGKTSLGNGLRALDFVKRANEAGVGIQITSNSWAYYQASRALNAAMFELGETQGVVSVIAAGNDSKNNDVYPLVSSTLAENPYVITVAASSQADELAGFSSYGPGTVELAAPGVGILSTTTPDDSAYIPGATDSDILFEDYEGTDPTVSVQQIDAEGNLVSEPARICTDMHFMGSRGIEVVIDSSYNIDGDVLPPTITKGYRFDFDLAAAQAKTGIDVVQALASAQDLYVGFGISSDKECTSTLLDYVKTNMTGDEPIYSSCLSGTSNGSITSTFGSLNSDEVERNVKGLNGHLLVDVFITTDEETPRLFFDTIAIGTETVPYCFKNGTSMACPTISGATAVLASQTGLEGAELASLVRSMIRVPKAGALPVRTGGVFDFEVPGSPYDDKNAAAPAISSMAVEGTKVTITGSNFGARPGSVDLARYVATKSDNAPVSAEVTTWSDSEVTLTLAQPFTGILRATLTNVADKHDVATKFVSKGETVFEQDLPFDSKTGDSFVLDGVGDLETRGPLVGLGCKLYYLPVAQPVEISPSYQRMLCFDLKTQTWSELPSLPEPLQGASAVMFEGAIVVEGATMQALPSGEPTDEFKGGKKAEERVYVYDPATSAWSQASSEGMTMGQTILNNDGQLMLVGGLYETYSQEDPDTPILSNAPAFNYSLDAGAIEELCPLDGLMVNPQAVARNGVIYIYNGHNYDLAMVKDGKSSMCQQMLPELVFDTSDILSNFQIREDPVIGWGVLMNASEGVIFVGPPAADGSTETYILRDGEQKFEPYEKRVSDDRVYNPAACTYRGRLFVIGSAWFEPGQRIFRATALDVPEYPGDIPCDEDPAPEPPMPEPSAPATPAATSKSASTQSSNSASKTSSRALPKTGDDAPYATVAIVAAFGVLALGFGLHERKRMTKRVSCQRVF